MIIIRFLSTVSYKRFKEFLNSLDEEYDSWSLDLQAFKDDRAFYDKTIKVRACAIISIDTDTDKIVGFCNIHSHQGSLKEILYNVSFVVKKEYQGNGMGTKMLIELEKVLLKDGYYTQMCGKHFTDNIASHKAFLKAGYEEARFTDGSSIKNMVWKRKMFSNINTLRLSLEVVSKK